MTKEEDLHKNKTFQSPTHRRSTLPVVSCIGLASKIPYRLPNRLELLEVMLCIIMYICEKVADHHLTNRKAKRGNATAAPRERNPSCPLFCRSLAQR